MGNHGQGAKQKDEGTAIDTRNGQRAVLTTTGERFDPPAQVVRTEALDAWEEYWDDKVSSLLTPADYSMLNRWVRTVNDYYDLLEQANELPLTEAQGGGLASNPLYKVVMAMASQITKMEAKLGIGPKNRASLGLQIIQGRQAEKEYNANWGGNRSNPQDKPKEEEDPRFS